MIRALLLTAALTALGWHLAGLPSTPLTGLALLGCVAGGFVNVVLFLARACGPEVHP